MQRNGSNQKSKRSKLPFCWIEKQKLRMINDVFSQKTGRAEAPRSLYVALCEIASDKQSDKFNVSQAEIAQRAAMSVASVKRILPILQRLGLIKIQRNSINGIEVQSTYTLIRGALAHHELPLAHQRKSKRATKKEYFEECLEGKARKRNTLVSNTQDNSLADNGDGFNKENGEWKW